MDLIEVNADHKNPHHGFHKIMILLNMIEAKRNPTNASSHVNVFERRAQ